VGRGSPNYGKSEEHSKGHGFFLGDGEGALTHEMHKRGPERVQGGAVIQKKKQGEKRKVQPGDGERIAREPRLHRTTEPKGKPL